LLKVLISIKIQILYDCKLLSKLQVHIKKISNYQGWPRIRNKKNALGLSLGEGYSLIALSEIAEKNHGKISKRKAVKIGLEQKLGRQIW